MDFYGDIDLKFNKIQQMVVASETQFPASPLVGRIVFKEQKLYMCVAIENSIPVWIPVTDKIDTYVHTQSVLASIWTVQHNLNVTAPLLQVYDSTGSMIIPESVTPTSNNEMTINFGSSTTGTAVVLFGTLLPTTGIGVLEPSNPFLSELTFLQDSSTPIQIDNFDFNSDGTFYFGKRNSTDIIRRYALSTAWDMSTAVYDGNFYELPNANIELSASGLEFNPDGLSIHVYDDFRHRIKRFNLTVAFDLTTASFFGQSNDITSAVGSSADFIFGDGGAKVYIASNTSGGKVVQYDCENGLYDTSSLINGVTLSIAPESAITGLSFSSNGSQFYVTGSVSDDIHVYSLTVPYSLATATLSVSVPLQNGNSNPASGLIVDNTAERLFVAKGNTGVIQQYTI